MIWNEMDLRYDSYLQDESRMKGRCDQICFPDSSSSLQAAVRTCIEEKIPVTIQGARTGITGGGVPNDGRLISTEKMSSCILNGNRITAQCGARLKDIKRIARSAGLLFPPNPTEESATIGGAFACAAAGPNCMRWGDVSLYVDGISVLLPDGQHWDLSRGQYIFGEDGCCLPDGRRLSLSVHLPPVGTPRWGYSPIQGIDLIDLFCGSEGILGVLDQFRLRLSPAPAQTWGLLFFFRREGTGLKFAADLISLPFDGAVLSSVEYLDKATLSLIHELKKTSSSLSRIPEFPPDTDEAIYLEVDFSANTQVESFLFSCLDLFSACGGIESDTWAATGSVELERLHLLRHAAAESVNSALDRCRRSLGDLTKLCAAYQTPLPFMESAAARYRSDMNREGIYGTIFGHASVGRLHINLLPSTAKQRIRAETLLEDWSAFVKDSGGHTLAENGIGKTKRALLARWAPPEQLEAMRQIKAFFDPNNLLGSGTLL